MESATKFPESANNFRNPLIISGIFLNLDIMHYNFAESNCICRIHLKCLSLRNFYLTRYLNETFVAMNFHCETSLKTCIWITVTCTHWTLRPSIAQFGLIMICVLLDRIQLLFDYALCFALGYTRGGFRGGGGGRPSPLKDSTPCRTKGYPLVVFKKSSFGRPTLNFK